MSEVSAELQPPVSLERIHGVILPHLEADFAAQAEKVCIEGDFLSQSRLTVVGALTGPVFGSTAYAAGRSFGEGSPIAGTLLAAAVLGGAALTGLGLLKRSYNGQHSDIHTAPTGQRFSFFASGLGKKRQTSVILQGTAPDKEMRTTDEIRVGAQLAVRHGVSDMIVPAEKAREIPMPDGAKVLPLHTWLEEKRDRWDTARPVGAETNVYVADPKAWLESLDGPDANREIAAKDVEYADKLRKIAPEHPVVKAYDFYKTDEALRLIRTRAAVAAGVEGDFQNSETVPNSEAYGPRTSKLAQQKSGERPAPQKNTHMPARSRQVAITGTLSSDCTQVCWTDQHGVTRNEDVFRSIGLSTETVEMLTEYPEVNPRLAAKVLSIKLAQSLAGKSTDRTLAVGEAELITTGPTKHEGVRRTATKPITAMLMGTYIAAIGGIVSMPPESSGAASSASIVGNAPPGGANYIEWNVQPHNMSPLGYWPQRTAYQYKDGVWISANITVSEGQPTPTSIPSDFDKWIAVDRQLKSGDIVGEPDDPLDQVVRIPDLEGTHIVAANISGKSVRLQRQADNGMAVSLPDSTGAGDTLKYWLAEGEDETLHATEFVEALNEQSVVDQDAVNDYWLKALDGKLPYKSSLRMKAQGEFIAKEFKYALEPYKENDFTKDHTPAEIVKNALEGNRRANCNVTSALLAFSNSELNVVTGYMMGSEDTGLNTASLHSWNVTRDGKRIDATPSRGASKEDKESLGMAETTEAAKKVEDIKKLGMYGLGVSLAAGLVLEHRRLRSSGRLVQRGVGRVAGGLLKRQGGSGLKVSYDLLSQVVYSGGRKVDLEGARSRAGRSELKSRDVADRLRGRDDLWSLHTLRQLYAQRKDMDKKTKFAAVRASVTAILAGASRWANPSKRKP